MEYAYKNSDLRNIKGEHWEDVPGLDGYFLISNFGRIKRCEYQMEYRNGAIYIKPEKLIKPQIVKQPNRFIGDDTSHLCVTMTLSGQSHNFTVARLVYYCFVRPFDLTDPDIRILTKDGDNFNIRPANLLAATRNQKQQRIVIRNRFRSPLLDLSEEVREENRRKIVRSKQKQVSQYTLSGKKLHTYQSMAQAQQATGISSVSISGVAKGKKVTAGGYIWRWGREARIDVKGFLEARRMKNRAHNGQKVTQYTLSGDRVARYPSLQDAQDATGVATTAIGNVIRGKYKSAHGFFWKKGHGPEKIDLTGYKWGRQSTAVTQSKPVAQYTIKGKHIQNFDSVKAAAASVGVNSASMSAACRGLQHTCKGYKWGFA
jgi:hypothetical protein